MYLFIINFCWGGGRWDGCVGKMVYGNLLLILMAFHRGLQGVFVSISDDPEVPWAWDLHTKWTTGVLLSQVTWDLTLDSFLSSQVQGSASVK